MGTENDQVNQEQQDAEMEAAFAASFDDKPSAPVEKSEPKAEEVDQQNVQVEEDTQQAPQTQQISGLTEDQIKLLTQIPELERRLTQQVDRVAGNYGEIKRSLDEIKKVSAAPKGAAGNQDSESDDLESQFPEIAQGVKARIEKAVSGIKQGIDESGFEAMYKQRREQEEVERRNENIKILEASHPDRMEIQKAPEWDVWMKTLPSYEVDSMNNSADGYYLSGMLSRFKTFRDEHKAKAQKSQKRISDAVAPTGARQTSHSTLTDDEAAQKAFDDQFK